MSALSNLSSYISWSFLQ